MPGATGQSSPGSDSCYFFMSWPDPSGARRRSMHADTTARKGVPDKPSFEPSGHQVQFYKDDAFIVATVARFATDALQRGRGAIVVATKAHLDAVLEKVGDVRSALRYNQLVPIDAEVLLSRFVIDGVPNEGLFVEN